MAETRKTEEPGCCTVKVVVEKDGADCCAEDVCEKVIRVNCDPDGSRCRTINVVCCPENRRQEE